MQQKKAFTLIELLVVISIIALLVAILMPALNKAREQASGTVCLTNQKTLMLAWNMYADEQEDVVPYGRMGQGGMGKGLWIEPPQDDRGMFRGALGDNPPLRFRQNGIRAGTYFKFANNVEVFHCPGDKRWLKGSCYGTGPDYQMYASYSVPHGIGPRPQDPIRKTSDIRNPSDKYAFVEESYDGKFAAFATGPWSFDYSQDINNPGSYQWHDMLSSWHNRRTTLSFVDGHAEMHGWEDERSIAYFLDRRTVPRDQPNNPDIRYMLRHHPAN